VALNNLSTVLLDLEDYSAAAACLQECLAIRRELGDLFGVATSLNNLGLTAFHQKDYDRARLYYEESIALYHESGQTVHAAYPRYNLGQVYKLRGDYVMARTLLAEGLAESRKHGDRQGVANDLEGLAYLAVLEQQPERAARLFGSAARLREAVGALKRPPIEQRGYEDDVNLVREALGETAFAATWEAGRALTWEEAVAEALGEEPAPSDS
jgi:non-specific serine/threonine protein kinase